MSSTPGVRRNTPPVVTAALVVLAVVLVAVGVVYLSTAASALPGFLPGHEVGVSKHHTKHGLAALAAAVVCLAAAWISTGRRTVDG